MWILVLRMARRLAEKQRSWGFLLMWRFGRAMLAGKADAACRILFSGYHLRCIHDAPVAFYLVAFNFHHFFSFIWSILSPICQTLEAKCRRDGIRVASIFMESKSREWASLCMVSSYSDKLPRLAQYKGRTSPTVASGERLTSLGCILSGKNNPTQMVTWLREPLAWSGIWLGPRKGWTEFNDWWGK